MNELMNRYPELEVCREAIAKTLELMLECFKGGGKLLVCGNGGSASDSEHIVGELMKGFKLKRRVSGGICDRLNELFPQDAAYISDKLQGALPAISLSAHSGLTSAFINDVAADMVYAQQVFGYGRPGDMLIGISTSGNSANVIKAVQVAKAVGMTAAVLTGEKPCMADGAADAVVHVPQTQTYKVQELHLPIYHYLCAACESEFFSE